MNIQLWELITATVGAAVASGWISSVIALRYANRKALANTQKTEAEAKQEEHKAAQEKANAESIIVANAKEIVTLYQDGMAKLTELHNQQSKELEERCIRIEKHCAESKAEMQKQLDVISKENVELRAKLDLALASTGKAELVEEVTKLKDQNKKLKAENAKLKANSNKIKKNGKN